MAFVDELKPGPVIAIVGGVAGVAGLLTGLLTPWKVGGRIGLGLGVAGGTALLGTLAYYAARTTRLKAGVHRVSVGQTYVLDASETSGTFSLSGVVTAFDDAEGQHFEPAPPDALAIAPLNGTAEVSVLRRGVVRIALGDHAVWVLNATGTSLAEQLPPLEGVAWAATG